MEFEEYSYFICKHMNTQPLRNIHILYICWGIYSYFICMHVNAQPLENPSSAIQCHPVPPTAHLVPSSTTHCPSSAIQYHPLPIQCHLVPSSTTHCPSSAIQCHPLPIQCYLVPSSAYRSYFGLIRCFFCQSVAKYSHFRALWIKLLQMMYELR